MIEPGTLPLRIRRWTPWKYSIEFVGYDFTGATFAAAFRSYRDAPGDPLIALANASSPTQGISSTVVTTDGVPTSTVEMRIDEATIEGVLPFAVVDGQPNRKAGSDVGGLWDIHITGGGLAKTCWAEGPWTIIGGAVH